MYNGLFASDVKHILSSNPERSDGCTQFMNISVFFRDSRPKIDPKDITIEELKGETVGRLPGTINGTEFIIRNCEVRFLLYSVWISTLKELLPAVKIVFVHQWPHK